MKKYKFTFTYPILIIIALGFACALGGIALNTYYLLSNPDPITYNYISFISVAIVGVFYIVFAISILVNSYYSVDDKYFTICWGFLKNRLEIKTITRVALDSVKSQLAIFYNEENYFIIKSKTIDFPELATLLRQKNKKIVFDFVQSEETDKK